MAYREIKRNHIYNKYYMLSCDSTVRVSINWNSAKILIVLFLASVQSQECPLNCTKRADEYCHLPLCADCEFTCNSNSCIKLCPDWCKKSFCGYPKCGECSFCSSQVSGSSNSKKCPITFKDVTSIKFSEDEKYWYSWKHSGENSKLDKDSIAIFADVI